MIIAFWKTVTTQVCEYIKVWKRGLVEIYVESELNLNAVNFYCCRSPFPKIKIHVKLMQRSNLLLLIMLYTMASLVNPQCPLLWDHLQPNCWKRFCFRSDNSVVVLAMVARSGYFPSFSLFSRGNTRRAGDVHDHSSHKGN